MYHYFYSTHMLRDSKGKSKGNVTFLDHLIFRTFKLEYTLKAFVILLFIYGKQCMLVIPNIYHIVSSNDQNV